MGADDAGVGASANVPRASRPSSFISLRHPPHHRRLRALLACKVQKLCASKICSAAQIRSVRCSAQRHKGGAHGPRPGGGQPRRRVPWRPDPPTDLKQICIQHHHIRATPNCIGRTLRAAACAQMSRHCASTARVSRGSITPSSSIRPLVYSASA